jgi:hypothetical protein
VGWLKFGYLINDLLFVEVGSWKLKVGSWRLEVGGWKLEVESWRLEVGSWSGVLSDPYIDLKNASPFSPPSYLKRIFHFHSDILGTGC